MLAMPLKRLRCSSIKGGQMKIDKSERKYLQKRRRDDIGEIFEWQERILRGIYPEKSAMVREFFESGFIPELIKENLFHKSWITNYECDNYGLIIEHKKIWPVIYPQEWTFSMLKDSALTVLRVAKIAKKYGYNMKDCHGFNVLFEKNQPKFIDLGSFHRNKEGATGWKAYQEFLRFYCYPLYTWKDGLEYISKLSIFSANLTPHAEHYIYKCRILRFLPSALLNKLIKIRFFFSQLACMDVETLNRKMKGKSIVFSRAVLSTKKIVNKLNIFLSQDLEKLEKVVKKINRKNIDSQWKHYHTNISKKKSRFERIVDYINVYCADAKTAIDLGGNQGLFSSKILKETNIEKIICQDLDEEAVGIGYRRHKDENIYFVNYNFIAPIVKTTYPLPWERFQADVVFALALLHHLILSQGFSLEHILAEINKYAKKYVCIEFMPKGLWVHGAKINVPSWYTVEWFRENFEKFFATLEEEQIAENYIVFIGKKRKGDNG